jgi:nicotinate phosphoribosyltransferase
VISSLTLGDTDLALATDLYQLTMAAAYHAAAEESGEMPGATFELWVRRLPPHRRFLVFAGLEQALASLQALCFTYEQLDYLRGLDPFRGVDDSFFEALSDFRFRGDVRAMPEGTLFFPDEPVLAVTGTLLETQIVETLLLSIVNFQTAIASKAARLRLAAGDEVKIAEFGSRRAHGPQAATWAARAAYVGGVDSTSNVLAGRRAGVPVVGTMAHSFIMSYEREEDAFRRYQRTFPDHTVLLVDTYDTLDGVRKALDAGGPFGGVRLDSGDLETLSRQTRDLLDAAGRDDATIFASGDMNEHKIAALRAAGAPIGAYGVGTQLATSADAPYLNGIYKLVEVVRGGEVRPTFKASSGKVTYPGPKQVIRSLESGDDGPQMVGDLLIRHADEAKYDAEARLLVPVMEGGRLLADVAAPAAAQPGDDPTTVYGVAAARRRCLDQLAHLTPGLRQLGDEAGEEYPVRVDARLEALLERQQDRISES